MATAFSQIADQFFQGQPAPVPIRHDMSKIFVVVSSPPASTQERMEQFWNEKLQSLFPPDYKPLFLEPADSSSTSAHNLFRNFWSRSASADLECDYRENANNASSGGFSAFRAFFPYRGEKTLRPEIIVRGKNADGTYKPPEAIESSVIHEIDHRIQTDVADVTHADISNSASPIVLSPLDKMMLITMSEADAAAKTAFLAFVGAQQNKNFFEMLSYDALSVKRFAEIYEQSADLQAAMTEAALASMNNYYGKSELDPESGEEWTYRDYYQAYALDTYVKQNSIRLRLGDKIEFVTLRGAEDEASLLKVGDSFAPNPFSQNGGLHPAFVNTQLKPSIAKKLAEVEAALGIDRMKLRGYNEALKAWNVSSAEYMGHSMGNKPKTPFPFQLQPTQPFAIKAAIQQQHADEMRDPDWSEYLSASPT